MITIDIEALGDALAARLEAPVVWLTVDEAAEHIRVSKRFLEGRLHEIPHSRLGKRVLIRRDELDGWVTDQRRRP